MDEIDIAGYSTRNTGINADTRHSHRIVLQLDMVLADIQTVHVL
jgi:hypothetical protein